MTTLLITFSNLVKDYGLLVFILLGLAILIFKRSLRNITVKKRWHRLLLRLPVFAYLIKSVNGSRYIHTFAILFSAGVNVLETMKVSASLVTNLTMRDAFNSQWRKKRPNSRHDGACRQQS